jgi:hypothetical protein
MALHELSTDVFHLVLPVAQQKMTMPMMFPKWSLPGDSDGSGTFEVGRAFAAGFPKTGTGSDAFGVGLAFAAGLYKI